MRPWTGAAVTRLRAAWALRLPLPCPRCGRPVHAQPADGWDLGHQTPRALDSSRTWDPANLRPEHASCNRAAGARMTNRARRGGVTPGWR